MTEKLNREMKEHKIVTAFHPDIEVFHTSYQDLFYSFHAGDGYENFNDFLRKEAETCLHTGQGVTYLLINCANDEGDLIGYFTITSTAIPYEDRQRNYDSPEEVPEGEAEFDIKLCGIPALEIKMFAINQKYQDVFYKFEDEELPVAVWILKLIIAKAVELSEQCIGFKAVFLHAIEEAESFYLKNGFRRIEYNMEPRHSVDSEFQAMYLPLYTI